MKKLLALLVALLMLLGTAALAEQEAAIMTLDHVVVEAAGQRTDVQDLSGSLVFQNVNNLPAVALLIDGGDQPLVTAVGQLTSKQFSLAFHGMDHGYTVDIPAQQAAQLAQVGDEGLAMLAPALVPMLNEVALPPLAGMDIPMLDMNCVLSGFITGPGSFEIPYEQVSALLDQILQLAKAQGKNIAQLDQALGMLEELKNSGTGIAIRGTIDDGGAAQKVVANVHLVENGKTADSAIVRLTLNTRQNDSSLAVAYVQSGVPINVATATLTADPAASRVDFDLSVIAGMGMKFAMYRDGDMNRFAFSFNAAGQGGNIEFAYGQQAGNDIVSFNGQAGGATVSFLISTVMGADGVRTGELVFSVDQESVHSGFSGDLTLYTGDAVDLSGFAMPADLRSFDQLDDNVMSQAFAPVAEYLSTHMVTTQAG